MTDINPKGVNMLYHECDSNQPHEQDTAILSSEESRAFVALLINPPKPNDALNKAAAHHRDLLGSDER